MNLNRLRHLRGADNVRRIFKMYVLRFPSQVLSDLMLYQCCDYFLKLDGSSSLNPIVRLSDGKCISDATFLHEIKHIFTKLFPGSTLAECSSSATLI